MPARTDIHRPAALITEDYEYLYSWDSQQPGCLVGIAQSDAWREWHAAGPVLPDVSSSQCTHCGAHIRYVALLRYTPTGQYLYVGETCLENRFELATADFHRLRKAAELDRKKQRILNEALDQLSTMEAPAYWVLCKNDEFESRKDSISIQWGTVESLTMARAHNIGAGLRHKLFQYGNLSVRQIELASKIARQCEDKVIKGAAQAAEIKVPVISGDKLTIEGVIVSIKSQPGYAYNTTDLKVTVKVTTPEGIYLVWGTLPSNVFNAEVGDTLRFVANVVKSDRDESFGFFKRPRNAEIVILGED